MKPEPLATSARLLEELTKNRSAEHCVADALGRFASELYAGRARVLYYEVGNDALTVGVKLEGGEMARLEWRRPPVTRPPG